nr:peptidylprolyl isomerase [Oribacterium sp. KHPX15]
MACSLVSCKGVEITGRTEAIDEYTEAQCRLVLFSERNRYQNALGTAIWELPLEGELETSYGPYFVSRMKEFLEDIKTLNLIAKETGIVASTADMDTIRRISGEFYDGLTEADKNIMGNCTLEDVITMYNEYFLACKTAQYFVSEEDEEIADADVKVIRIQEIIVSDKAAADDLLEKVNVKGANFAYYARQNSEDTEIEKTISRAEEQNARFNAAFALEQGEISGVIEQDGKFHIIKCINSYDEEATAENKVLIQNARKTEAFFKTFNGYTDEHIIRFRSEFWKNIDLSTGSDSKAENFFSLFDENVILE